MAEVTIEYMGRDGLPGRFSITRKPPLSGRSCEAWHVYHKGCLAIALNDYARCMAFVKEEMKRMGYTQLSEELTKG